MSDDYAKRLRKNYMADCEQIRGFLAAPDNENILRSYEQVAEEFELKIIAKRKEYQTFDEVMNYLGDLLFNRDSILASNRRLTRILLFYMYRNCDTGLDEDASPE